MTRKAPFRAAFPAAAAILALTVLDRVPAGAAEMACRESHDYSVEVNGAYPPDARFFVADAHGKYLVDIPSESKAIVIDLVTGKAVTVPRAKLRTESIDGTVRVDERCASDAPAYALSIEGSTMRFRTGTSRVRVLQVAARPSLAATSGIEATASEGASALPCLQLVSRPAPGGGTPGCMKFVYLVNSCKAPVMAHVGRTEHLFSGTSRQTFSVLIPSSAEQPLGCSWWGGAVAPTGHEVLAAGFLEGPTGPDTGGDRCTLWQ